MGCVCGKPSPPPNTALIGKWGSDDEVAKWNVGYGVYRVKRGPVLFGSRMRKVDFDRTRIEIKASGWISYVCVTKNNQSLTVIDMPVTYWLDGLMEVPCHKPLPFHLVDDQTLVVCGVKLKRLEHGYTHT